MTSSFLILTPDVPALAMSVTSTTEFSEDYPIYSSVFGRGYLTSRLSESVSSVSITFDLGSGASRTIDHLVVGGIKSLLSTNVNKVVLQGSSDGATWANQLGTVSSFASKIVDGPNRDTVIFTQARNDDLAGTLAAYRYFRVTMQTSSGLSNFPFSKLYFGQAFDMGKEPDNYDLKLEDSINADTWQYARGHSIMSKAFYPKHQITVEWDGVPDAKANEFFQKILSDPWRNTVYLYTQNYQDPLYDNTLMLCRVVPDSCSITKLNDVDNWNDIVAVFEEV